MVLLVINKILLFSNASGYLPVTKSANDLDKITDEVEVNESVKKNVKY